MTYDWDAIVAKAVADGWREEDIATLLAGPAMDGNGHWWAVCEACGRMEYEDGLIPTEREEHPDGGVTSSGFVCPPCVIAGRRPTGQ